jgi:hypothetical protein
MGTEVKVVEKGKRKDKEKGKIWIFLLYKNYLLK